MNSQCFTVSITAIFDTTCPWCFIGKRRLDKALEQRPALPITLMWQALLLNPMLARSGVVYHKYLEERLGGEENAKSVQNTLIQIGKSMGIPFAFDKIKTLPNTLASHALVGLARRAGCASEVVDALFTAYLCEGRDIGALDVLLEIGEQYGIQAAEAETFIDSPLSQMMTLTDNDKSRKSGCRGVPAFLFNTRMALVGAQEVPVFVRMLDVAAEAALTPFPLPEQEREDDASSL